MRHRAQRAEVADLSRETLDRVGVREVDAYRYDLGVTTERVHGRCESLFVPVDEHEHVIVSDESFCARKSHSTTRAGDNANGRTRYQGSLSCQLPEGIARAVMKVWPRATPRVANEGVIRPWTGPFPSGRGQ